MKKTTLILIVLAIFFTGMAKGDPQENTYKQFYRAYRGTDDVFTFKIPAGLANFFIDKEEKEVKAFMKKMDDISFLIASELSNKLIYDLNKSLPESTYKELMVVKDGESEITFLAKEGENFITEIIMAVYDPDSLVVMCINGDFTKEDAKKIVKSINTDSAISFRN